MNAARIIVATDVTSDAELVSEMLSVEFDAVRISVDPERFDEDFADATALVLVIAFKTVEAAERYYLGLYRFSNTIHGLPHRTIVLCAREEVRKIYEICRKNYFDDYVLFWPMSHDSRLPMSVHLAQRALTMHDSTASLQKMATQARRLGELEDRLREQVSVGGAHAQRVRASLSQSQEDIGHALDRFSGRVLGGELDDAFLVRDRQKVENEILRLNRDHLQPLLAGASEAAQPMEHWVGSLMSEVAPQLDAAREIAGLAGDVKPIVMVVDDDEFQRKVLMKILSAENYQVLSAATGTEAMATLRMCHPDLVLMDIQLPDDNGIDITRRMKASAQYREIPVIMMTGHSERLVIVDALGAGAVDFVVKPLDRDVLLRKLARYLGR